MQASLLGEAVPTAERLPSAAPDRTREERLREFQEAFANAWREGVAQGAPAMAETPPAPAGPPIPTASATPPTVTDTATTTAVVALPIASATANLPTPPPTPIPPPTAAATADPPAAPAIAVADAGPQDVHVIIYSASWCPACQRAKAWMTAHDIAFEERDIDASTEYVQQLRLLNPSMSIPTFDIDGKVTVGFPQVVLTFRRTVLLPRLEAGAL
jgi:glutaredoxin 3